MSAVQIRPCPFDKFLADNKTGDFSKAVKTAEEAVKLLEAAGKKDAAEKIRGRLELYKSGQPYREK